MPHQDQLLQDELHQSSTMRLYHYTTTSGLASITKEGVVRRSTASTR